MAEWQVTKSNGEIGIASDWYRSRVLRRVPGESRRSRASRW